MDADTMLTEFPHRKQQLVLVQLTSCTAPCSITVKDPALHQEEQQVLQRQHSTDKTSFWM